MNRDARHVESNYSGVCPSMLRRLMQLFAIGVSILLVACGGGGGGFSDVRVSGQVLDISTGAPLTSVATVQSSSATANTVVADGSFLVGAPRGETTLLVNPPALIGYPSFTYKFEPLNQNQNDVQTLWVGPQKVTVRGTVRNAANSNPISNALVRFAGQFARTDTTGTFSILNVAYHPTSTAGFLGLVGQAEATGFLLNEFTTNGNLANAGVVTVGDVLLSPVDSSSPPPSPFTIWGLISPGANAPNTIVRLKDNFGTLLRQFTVGSDARYQFWIEPGTYKLEFQNGALTAPTQNVTLTNSTDVVRADATLS